MQLTDPFGWVGTTIDGQFVVEAVAGEGAFGVVYRGTHIGLDAPIAIKCLKLPGELSKEEQQSFLGTFRDEARILHRLSRRTLGIVQALDVGAAGAPSGQWTPYTIMEWLDGDTLEQDLRKRRAAGLGPRALDAAIDLIGPAASALAIAHEENITHRDIKPANLLLARSRSGTMMKVLDFGVAKVFADAPELREALAQTGKNVHAFTPRYGAPEQFSPRYGATGPWTDVFAMALVLIEVASGRAALVGFDVVQLFVASSNEESRPSLRERGVPADSAVEAVVARALAVRPEDRYQTIGEMWAALEAARRLGAGRPPLSTPPPAPPSSYPGSSRPGSVHPPSVPPPSDIRLSTARSVSLSGAAGAGENRVCTVMFVDLSEVTELSARLDPEDVQEITEKCFEIVRAQVEAIGGFMEKPIGDRAMAVFGVPRATDNDAERAVVAALRIEGALGRLALPRAVRSTRVSARIGISTGRAFAGAASGPSRQEFTVIGDAANVASRLQQTAPKGAIVIGRDTFRHVVGLFNAEALDPIKVAGRSEALPVYRVTGAIAIRSPIAPSDFHGVATKLVGRAAERQRLLDALEGVKAGRRAAVLTLVGPPGVGRSRLLADFFTSLAGRSDETVVLLAQGSPLAMDTSYGFAASLLRRRFDIHESDGPEAVRRKLLRGVRWFRLSRGRGSSEGAAGAPERYESGGYGGDERDETDGGSARSPSGYASSADEIADVVRQAAAMLGAAPFAREGQGAMGPDDAGAMAKPRISAAVARLVSFAASRLPVVLLCDDIQWADDASLDLLADLAVRLADLPVLVVCAARPELYERRPSWGGGAEAHERVDVAPLPRRYVEEMVKDRLRRVRELSPEIMRLLVDRAEGSPLTLTETLHLLIDAGVIEMRAEGRWLVHEGRLGALALPATVQGIVQARLDQLDPAVRGVLARAAVVGRTFWEGAVEHLRQSELQRTSLLTTADLCARLRDRQLIRAREPSTFPGERENTFAESATHEVAYEMLSQKVRRVFHLLVAEWLEAHAQRGASAALLALHYDRGGDPRRAAAEHVRAAAHATSLGEHAEARRHLVRAREIHDESEGEDPTASSEDRRVASFRDRVRLRIELGDVLRRMGKLDEAERSYEEARARCIRTERRRGEVLERAEVLAWDARIDFRLALVNKVRGATKPALELVLRAIERANEASAIEETPAMFALLAFLRRRERRPDESWQAALRGLRVCRSLPRRDEEWREAVAQLLFGVAAALYARGRFISAERTYRQALRAVSEAASPHIAGIALNGAAVARVARGELKGAREMLLRSLALKERAGDLHQIAVAYNNLAEVELRLRDPAALDHARRSVRLGEQARAGSDLADMYRNLAEASLAVGELTEALDTGQKALAIAEVSGRVYLGDVAVSFARVCAKASAQVRAKRDAPLAHRLREAEAALEASLVRSFDDKDLREKAEECRKLLQDGGSAR
jgi:class 3 adenylate cyclase/tetratricopeptide (TPR) repeat protein